MALKIQNRIAAAIIAVAALAAVLPSASYARTQDILNIAFDDVATNDFPGEVGFEGSENARVVEDGVGNKAFSMDTGFIDNTFYVDFVGVPTDNRFVIQFDAGFRNMAAGGEIAVNSAAGTSTALLNIRPDGKIYTTDGKHCGGISLGGYTNIAVVVDPVLKFFSVFVNEKCSIDCWALPASASDISGLQISTNAGTKAQAQLLLDNIRVYKSETILRSTVSAKYNSDSVEFTPVEEDKIPQKVYINDTLDSGYGGTLNAKNNEITAETDTTGNRYIRINKKSNNDAMVDNTLSVSSKNLVFELDVRYDGQTPGGTGLFFLRDTASGESMVNFNPLRFSQGVLKAGSKTVSITKRTWHTVSLLLDLAEGKYDIYVDGNPLLTGGFISSGFQKPTLWRIYVEGGTEMGELLIDNLRAYEGTEIRDISGETAEKVSVYSDDAAEEFLSGKTALAAYNNKLYAARKKQTTDLPCIIEGDEVLVSPETMKQLFGEQVNINGGTIRIGNVTMTEDSTEMKVGTKTVNIETAPRVVDGVMRIPARAYGMNALEEGCFVDDEHGMFVVSQTPVSLTDTRLKEANKYLFFNRYSAQELKEKLTNNMGGDLTKHPRILADGDDFARLREEIKTDANKSKWFEAIKKKADNYMSREPQEYQIINNRLLDVANEAVTRTGILGMAYQITGDTKYADRCRAELEKICSYQDWHPDHSLDSGTMALAVAIGFDWIYDTLTPAQRQSIMEASKRLGLEQGEANYYGTATYRNTFWNKTETNWGAVVNSGYMNLAFAIAELDIDYTMDIAEKALRSMEYPIYRIAPDGAWYEGPSYWNYFFRTLCYGLAGYESAIGETHEAVNYKGAQGLCDYQLYFSDPSGYSNNFHDGNIGKINCEGQFYFADKHNRDSVTKLCVEFMDKNNIAPNIYNLLWYDVDSQTEETEKLPTDGYFREAEFMSMRQNWDDENALWVSAHGGYANEAHDHIDNGTFVMNLGGIRWAIDLGQEPFSYQTPNPALVAGYDGYYYYRRKGEGHNIVVINPDDKLEMLQDQFAEVSKPVSSIGRAYSTIDLSASYEDVNSYKRGYLLSEGRRAFTVRDEIDLKESSELYWFMHTKGEIIIVDNNTALINQDGKQLKVQFITDAAESELTVMAAEKLPQSPKFTETANTGVSKLTLKLKASGRVNITAKMSLASESPSSTPPEDIPIDQWTVEGDDTVAGAELESSAALDSITLNGTPVYGFSPDTFHYTYSLEEGEPIPQVGASGSDDIEQQTYSMPDGSTVFEIRAIDETGLYRPYVVKVLPYVEQEIAGYKRHKVVGADVSSEQTSENNVRANSYDGDFNTRWSAKGEGEWIVHDLGEEREIDAVGIAFFRGSARKCKFDILVSTDGENFTKLMSETSSGTTDDLEVYELDETVKARYVKFVGYGSDATTNGEWNNVVELAALQTK